MKWSRIIAAAVLLVPLALTAQNNAPAPDSQLANAPAAKSYFVDQATAAEQILVPFVLQRPQANGDERTLLELHIDLQIFNRWFTTSTTTDELAAVSYLRLNQLHDAITTLEQQLESTKGQPLNAIQKEAAGRLHQLTYNLPSTPTVAQMDAAARVIGWNILLLATRQNADAAKVPSMRPSNLPPLRPENTPERPAPTAATTSKSDPASLIPQLTVSSGLRQQLLQTLDMTRRPQQFQLTDADVKQLEPILLQAIDISAGLASNAAVDADKRTELEQRLTESLALYGDKRLRDLAVTRIQSLAKYRQVLGSITRLNLSQATYQVLSPAFVYAQQHPQDAQKVLADVENFVNLCLTYDSLPATLPAPAAGATSAAANLSRQLEKFYLDARKNFTDTRGDFLGTVEQLGNNTITQPTPADLDKRLDDMRTAMDILNSLGALPLAVDTLNTFKPRPIGGLERRITKEAGVAVSPEKGPLRKDAALFLTNILRLAATARELDNLKIEGPALEAFSASTNKTPEDFLAKCRINIYEIASQAAAGTQLDHDKLDRTASVKSLCDTLASAGNIEAQLRKADVLARWADWGLDATALNTALEPYRTGLTNALLGIFNDATEPDRSWPGIRKEQQPLINFILRSINGAALIPAQPTPIQTQCAKLMTPMTQAEFLPIRQFGLSMMIIGNQQTTAATAESLRKDLLKRLAQL